MSPIGRPRIFDMEAVLEAAMLLFWEQGYEATSLAQLRETTGLSSASLYGAFGSKEGLFEKAVEHYIAGPGSVTDVVADEAESPREAIARLLHGSINMQTDPSHPRGCLVALSGTVRAPGAGEAGARKVVAARRAADRARIRACVVRGITSSGELAEDTDVDGLTSMIHGFLLGISTQVCDGTSARHLHAAADAVLANWDTQGR
ncbi:MULTISPECIES: TetR/AcrR family transcriptional regulator [unclassified Streptomyces]|uniref:TetR/AcrR family transcriptional regulator n=1 Tax=unclassified Streptomyces TaxID=2593676 RepID=UPI002DDA6136|nr:MULTISPECIES: TetR/AcrR family transcriptional regulator [unclassified Streptomyces]WSA93311.1 TetR/AcrR family transcriptional regulator [Streptomyces sp. NBC_01795]WSB77699.1 TetR/AcrR family transcriptional regulator [Streptomyces sp. NBC_01775]WSS14052.1 TetR/AcrR family transcriptional regulator [Streptomyces sp. NBC_01186]WSS42871.1 TetR/AcrR family transcriptional regulator [Streptomyces sp. NBC_01187]